MEINGRTFLAYVFCTLFLVASLVLLVVIVYTGKFHPIVGMGIGYLYGRYLIGPMTTRLFHFIKGR